MKMIKISAEIYVPDPDVIAPKYLRDEKYRTIAGPIVAAWDPDTRAGGLLNLNDDPMFWMIYIPVDEDWFMDKAAKVLSGAIKAAQLLQEERAAQGKPN